MPMPAGYYSRFDPERNYERHLFRAGRVLQSAELNEIQENAAHQLRSVGDSLFRDGDIVRDCRIHVNRDTGLVQCESGAIYLRGMVRGVPPATFTIPTSGTVSVGIRLTDTVIDESGDDDLRDPAVGLRNYREPGAARLRVDAAWGWDGDGGGGDFYAVYWIDDGQLRPKEAPPQIDMVSLSLARYDRDSAGGTYIISGLEVTGEADSDGKQVYTIAEGRARCYGHPIDLQTSMRVTFEPQPYARSINTEPHLAAGGTERINVNNPPIAAISGVQIVRELTVSLTHGAFSGVSDPIGYNSVLQIVGVKGGGADYDSSPTTYAFTSDYLLTGDMVDWSPAGAEPATGATYHVRFRYLATVSPINQDAFGFDVEDAVPGTNTLVSYSYYVKRIDRLCFNRDGQIVWVKGVPADYNPWPPEVGSDLLPMALVYQTWTDARRIHRDGARMVPMPELDAIQGKLDRLIMLTAQERLKGDANLRDQSLKKSIFVDPFLDESMRDDGQVQTAAVFDGLLTLSIDGQIDAPDDDVTSAQTLPWTASMVLGQEQRTGCMLINPYQAFEPIPSKVELTPAVDHWVQTNEVWASSVTRLLSVGSGTLFRVTQQTDVLTLSSTSAKQEFLRQIEVRFFARGFGPNEALSALKFDGITVPASPL